MTIDALILAGGRLKGDEGSSNGKGFLELQGKPMVSHVASALRSTGTIGRILVAAPDDVVDQLSSLVDEVEFMTSSEEDSLLEKLLKGLNALGGQGPVLIAAADIPLLTKEAITDFIDKCLFTGADICYPIVKREDVEAQFPDTRRTWIKLAEGNFTGGNLMLVKSEVMLANKGLIERVYSLRKSPFRLVGILGVGFALKLVFKRLRLIDIEQRCSAILGVAARLIVTPYAEIGVDVDKPDDLEIITARLATKT